MTEDGRWRMENGGVRMVDREGKIDEGGTRRQNK
jgi:hypothetical protein